MSISHGHIKKKLATTTTTPKTIDNHKEVSVKAYYEYYINKNGDLVDMITVAKTPDRVFIEDGKGVEHKGRKFMEVDVNAAKQFAAIVAGESSLHVEEGRGIGHVVMNRLSLSDSKVVPGFTNKIGASGIYAMNKPAGNPYPDTMAGKFSDALWGPYKEAIKGALGSISPLNADCTEGAFFWENHTSYKQPDNWHHRHVTNKTLLLLHDIGNSYFFKYNPNKIENPNNHGNKWP